MVKIIDLDCCVVVGDGDKLVEVKNCGTIAVVSEQDNLILITFGKGDGTKTYVVSREFAKALSETLKEYSK